MEGNVAHFNLTYCLQDISAPEVPKALSTEELGLGEV